MRLKDFVRISEYEWEIPKDYRPDMRVPVRVFASRPLLEAVLEDKSLEQAVNVATLPGVVGWVLVMPDVHQGYGFPIGGVAAMKYPSGVISPGGVGYDINCLTGDARVLHEHGYTRPIQDLAEAWRESSLACVRLAEGTLEAAAPALWFARPPHRPVLRVTTESGLSITATSDHPFWTPDGMVEVGQLQPGDPVAVYPFEGVPYEPPPDDIIVDEEALARFLASLGKGEKGNAATQIIRYLKRRNLLPLRYSSPALPYLIKLLGYLFGDGTLYFEKGTGKGIVAFYGREEDLEDIRRDLLALGVTPSRIYTRRRQHTIYTGYATYTFEHTSPWFKVSSTAFAALLAFLGAPVGAKATQAYGIPAWLEKAPLWQKRLFLAALFGAELSAPQTVSGHAYNLASPVLSLNKRHHTAESGRRFLEDIARWLEEFGVRVRQIAQREEQIRPDGTRATRLRLVIAADPENLIRLWSRVGYEYNRKRRFLGLVAVHYLRLKQKHIARRKALADQATALAQAGYARSEIVAALAGPAVNERFIERSLYEGRRTSPRVAQTFPTFHEFVEEATAGLGKDGLVWDRIARIEEVPSPGLVYDLTMAHEDHNFIANAFLVSNCGVRLLATQMPYEAAEPYLDTLATLIDQYCPSGVGRGGPIKLSESQLDQVAREGAYWALKQGYALKEDLERTEEQGRIPGADPSKVSKEAKRRGRTQLGSIGAGNHFIEVDVIEQIFDPVAAEAFGLTEGMLAVQIHCGSRGFGHQICSDYVRSFQKVVHKYGIRLPDRELVSAPMDSPEGRAYLAAMAAAANFAFANRQVLAHFVRQAFEDTFRGKFPQKMWFPYQVYDVAHNIAKLEVHNVDGRRIKVAVHRKGATRAFGPGSPVIPQEYRDVGQPVLVPGSMGTASWVLVGTEESMRKSFGSSCHGAGRTLSRAKAKKSIRGETLLRQLEGEGIHVRAGSMRGLAEEAPFAYKDVDLVVETVAAVGIARKVARLRPVAVIKG